VCAALLFGLMAPTGALAGDLDQQQTSDALGLAGINSSQSLAQTFTAGKAGRLDQVDLDLKRTGAPPSLTVELWNVSSGSPGNQALASTSVLASSVPTTTGFIAVPFAAGAMVAPGTQYAIVAYSSGSGGDFYQWAVANDTLYSGGTSYGSSASPPTTWFAGGTDTAFKTYVASPSTPATTSTPTGRRAAALKKCKKKHSAKARKRCRKRAKKLPV
jgi:hypothetical protein